MDLDLAEQITEKAFTFKDGDYTVDLYNKTGEQIAELIEAYQLDKSGDDISRGFVLLDAIKDWLLQHLQICKCGCIGELEAHNIIADVDRQFNNCRCCDKPIGKSITAYNAFSQAIQGFCDNGCMQLYRMNKMLGTQGAGK